MHIMQLITLYYRFILMVVNLHKNHAYSACFSGSCINDLDFYPWYIMHILHVFEGDIPEYLARNDIFSPKSKKLHFRHRKYIYCINLCITCFLVFRVSMLVVYIHD